jgi:hypothetical protein
MKSLLVIVFASAIGLAATSASAQDVVLSVDVSRDGSLIAKPQLRIQSGRQGMLTIDERGAPTAPAVRGLRERITLTPTIQGENVSIALDITSDTKKFRPSLAISKGIKGSFEWVSSEGQTIRLTVSWAE